MQNKVSNSNFYATLKQLSKKGFVHLYQESINKVKEATEEHLFLDFSTQNSQAVESAFEILKNSPAQKKALLLLISAIGKAKSISKSEFVKKNQIAGTILKELQGKNLIRVESLKTSFFHNKVANQELKQLTPSQAQSLTEIYQQWEKHQTVVLWSWPGAGKAEITFHIIKEKLKLNKPILFLAPDLLAAQQLTQRLQANFGWLAQFYNPKFNASEQYEFWQRLNTQSENPIQIIVGTRNSVLLPFSELGLIVIDDEQDSNYKNNDTNPKFNARDTAIMLANKAKCKVLLLSSVPALKTYLNIKETKFGLVKLESDYKGITTKKIDLVALGFADKNAIHTNLKQTIDSTLAKNQQVVLIQNRKGFARYVQCKSCSWIPYCVNCNVPLVYFKSSNELKCNYCNHKSFLTSNCENCSSSHLELKGSGTERVEEDIKILFPNNTVKRVDVSTLRTKTSFDTLLNAIENHKVDIIIGTQTLSKGINYSNLGLVAFINVDSFLAIPSYNTTEKAFQSLVNGIGRLSEIQESQAVLQTYNIKNNLFNFVLRWQVFEFLDQELQERQKFSYPPYYNCIELICKHNSENYLEKGILDLMHYLLPVPCKQLGPILPLVNKINNLFIKSIILKIPKTLSYSLFKENLVHMLKTFEKQSAYKKMVISINVDA